MFGSTQFYQYILINTDNLHSVTVKSPIQTQFSCFHKFLLIQL